METELETVVKAVCWVGHTLNTADMKKLEKCMKAKKPTAKKKAGK